MTIRPTAIAISIILLCTLCFAGDSPDEQAIWKLEHAYWEDVKALDLAAYRDLWHSNFVGWPYVSARPARKDHITDWITANTAKGLHLESYSIEPADSQATDNLVVVHYWAKARWVDKDGRGDPSTLRITHTWVRVGKGWQIISGMSSPEPDAKKKVGN